MTVLSLLDEMVVALTRAGILFMLTGSFAAAVHGAGRSTLDIDFVIDPTPASLVQFVKSMQSTGRYVSMDAAEEAMATRSMFNVVDVESGWKIDLIVRKNRPFSIEEFSRRVDLALGNVTLPVATVEDLVIAKLERAQLGGSARQLEDVRALVSLAGPVFGRAYVERWVSALGLGAQSQAIGPVDLL